MGRILILGGTLDASALARAVAECGRPAVFSYAGRVDAPRAQPVATRIGGFGGVDGLVRFIRDEDIAAIVDATHPFAAQMSRNALAAAQATATPLLALERAPWQAQDGECWQNVPDIAGALAALAGAPQRIFLAIGRQTIDGFAAQPQHHYLLRLVDRPQTVLPLPDAEIVIARGPFTLEGDLALLKAHRIDRIVAKNAGGEGARAKLDAARILGLGVVMIERPGLPARPLARSVDEAMAWLDHTLPLGV